MPFDASDSWSAEDRRQWQAYLQELESEKRATSAAWQAGYKQGIEATVTAAERGTLAFLK